MLSNNRRSASRREKSLSTSVYSLLSASYIIIIIADHWCDVTKMTLQHLLVTANISLQKEAVKRIRIPLIPEGEKAQDIRIPAYPTTSL